MRSRAERNRDCTRLYLQTNACILHRDAALTFVRVHIPKLKQTHTMDLYKNFPDSRLNFNPSFSTYSPLLHQHQISTMDLLTTAPIELAQRTTIPQKEIQQFIHTLTSEVIPGQTYSDRLTERYISTGDKDIDVLLGGGILLGQITEIFGEAATGKSQLCMQLTKAVTMSEEEGGMDAMAVYISTEGNLETKRLVEINDQLDKVFCINCSDLETQQHIIEVQLPLLIERQNVRLVVIDSISHHLRVELENSGYKSFIKNKKRLTDICKTLLDICCERGIALVVTNQMSELPEREILPTDYKKISMDYQMGWISGWDDESLHEDFVKGAVPTLGITWSNNVMARISLKKKYYKGCEEFWSVKRRLRLVYSNSKPEPAEVEFKITARGISSVD